MSIDTIQAAGAQHLRESFTRTLEQRAKLNGAGPTQRQQLRKLAKDFESVFVKQLLDAAQESIADEDGLLSSGAGKQMQSMFWMFLSQDVADKGGLGMADQLYKEFCRMAELDPKAIDAPTVEHLQ